MRIDIQISCTTVTSLLQGEIVPKNRNFPQGTPYNPEAFLLSMKFRFTATGSKRPFFTFYIIETIVERFGRFPEASAYRVNGQRS